MEFHRVLGILRIPTAILSDPIIELILVSSHTSFVVDSVFFIIPNS